MYTTRTDIRSMTALILAYHNTRFKTHHARVRSNRCSLSLSLSLSLRVIISNINIIQSCVDASIRPNKQHQSINKLFNVREKLLRGNRVMTRARIDGTTFSAKQNLIKSLYRRMSVYTGYASNSM